jgi:prepilin-type processing-associated H-X9-DG protein
MIKDTPSSSAKRAFTLIELLVIIVIVFVLGGMLLPALARTKGASQAMLCLRNHKELQLACQLYASSYEGRLCNNFTIPETFNAISKRHFDNWANNVMSWGIAGLDGMSNTNVDWVKQGVLAKFASNPVEMCKCPSDRYLSLQQRNRGWDRRLRSVAMNAFFGRSDTSPNSANGRSWAEGGAYRQFLKTSDVPEPANTWVTIDEHPDSLNDGFFVVPFNTTQWGDFPASYHDGAGTFSFADGHGETHKWLRVPSKGVYFGGIPARPFDAAGRRDYAWYKDRTGYVPFR